MMTGMGVTYYLAAAAFFAAGAGGPRPPAVAGAFYPGDPAALAAAVDRHLAEATLPVDLPSGRLLALLAPHAGYVYSGPCAGHAYKLLQGREGIRRVLLLGLSHRVPLVGAAVDPRPYATPLGVMPYDESLAVELKEAAAPHVTLDPRPGAPEHSLEVHVPFLQRTLPGASLVPLVVGQTDAACRKGLAAALAALLRAHPDLLLVVSTDLSHFHPYETAKRLDGRVNEAVAALDPARLSALLDSGEGEMCGEHPVLAALEALAAFGGVETRFLKYQNSGDTAGDRGQVVGYAAHAFFAGAGTGEAKTVKKSAPAADKARKEKVRPENLRFELDAAERAEILKLARATLESWVRERKVPPYESTNPKFNTKCGAFVTLHMEGELRGCIGYVEAVEPLWRTIQEMAVSASTKDPRFPPVRPDELASITLEVSVLSPLEVCDDVSKIVVGTHGIVIRKGWNQGLLLPQVAVEWGWDRDEFLAHTCRKAGLPPDAWRSGAEIRIFSAQVFGEEEGK